MIKNNPKFTLNNGVEIPAIGLGVLQNGPEETLYAVKTAIANGYRLIDTAKIYGNEQQVGDAIKASGIDRSEIFVTTKLWMDDYGYENALKAFDTSLQKLSMDYVDLFLIHWPVPAEFDLTVKSYQAVEKLYKDGRAKAIGVSNFKTEHLKILIDRVETVPAINQVELHPYFIQKELRDAHKKLGIVTQAWSPIGGSVRRFKGKDSDPLTNHILVEVAEKYGKSTAQVILRWHFQNGIAAIPKSSNESRIKANFNIFDFELSTDEISSVDALDTGERGGPDPDIFDLEMSKSLQQD